MRAEQILTGLDDEQRIAVLAPPGPVLIAAGAGTGKTRTITHRIAYHVAAGNVPGSCVLAVTHSSKAAGEMRDRIARFGVDGGGEIAARTFHAAALKQLRHFWAATGRPGDRPQLTTDRYGLVRGALRRLEKSDPDAGVVFDIAGEIGWAKTQLLTPARYAAAAAAAGRTPPRDLGTVAKLYTAYEAAKDRAGHVDFDDLLALCADLLETDPHVAGLVRARYRFLVVDEYQDTDPAQQRLLDAWLGPDNDVLTVVGDPRQSIYGFRGASGEHLAGFASRYPAATVVHLTRDYRSHAPIVAAANALVATAGDATAPPDLISVPGDGPRVTVRSLQDEPAEAGWVAAQVRRALEAGVPAREIAILYRYNSQSAPFEQVLTAAGIPYTVADNERFFDRPEIVAVLTEMRRRLDRSRTRGAGWDDAADTGGGEEMLSGPQLLREVLADSGYDRNTPPAGAGAARERWEAVAALLGMVESMPSAELLGSWPLLIDLETRRAEAHTVTADVVTLATLHQAKGLEWDSVFLPRAVEGSLPSMYATTPDQLAEERRLFYVGITRAKRILVVTSARERERRRGRCTPSRFLADAGLVDRPATVPATRSPRRAAQPGARGQAAGARCRRCTAELLPAAATLGRCAAHLEGPAAKLFAQLRTWRAATAREGGMPAYRVLPDAALLALVAVRPADDGALLTVPGIGQAKVDSYGAALLELLAT